MNMDQQLPIMDMKYTSASTSDDGAKILDMKRQIDAEINNLKMIINEMQNVLKLLDIK